MIQLQPPEALLPFGDGRGIRGVADEFCRRRQRR